MVLLSDGKGRGRPVRLELTKDVLIIQIAKSGFFDETKDSVMELDNSIRHVKLRKKSDGGLGLSIKGGNDGNQQVSVVISKIFQNTPAEECGQLYVGDVIVEINGQSTDGKSHDEIVQILKNSGDEVTLSVRHYIQIAPYLKPADSLRSHTGSAFDRLYEPNTWKSSLKVQSLVPTGEISSIRSSTAPGIADGSSDEWKTMAKIPLPMAFITRYLWGTDKLRNNAFEVRAVDGSSTGIVHCEDKKTMEQWFKHIQSRITSLNYKSIKLSNRYLHKNEQITYIGWVSERLPEEHFKDPRQRWEPRFIILKGGELCIFESPPLNSDDLNKCVSLYKIYDTAFKVIDREKPALDKREYCFWIETSMNGLKHYMSVENHHQFNQFDVAYHRCLHSTVNSFQTRTFACSYQGRPSGLVIDIKQGISLYDISTKRYSWQYRFCDLESSSDDGKIRLRLTFRDPRSSSNDNLEIKDIDSDELLFIVYTMHAFYVTKVIGTDPDYLKIIPLT
ncbi:gamma-1-syntrophin [Loa loa]|uniref:Gamma-1-syntrophin n=1 Tax=Loa loa TaxID=7209 RepID=A0A1I7VPE7_LOALO|nr:gamma-1-syntrophin [Loa loa]EJD76531.1 gamma-1-syntrophin [Loa loa]